MTQSQEKKHYKKIIRSLLEAFDYLALNTKDKELRDRIKFMKFKIYLGKDFGDCLNAATVAEVDSVDEFFSTIVKIKNSRQADGIENVFRYFESLVKKNQLFSFERIKVKETVESKFYGGERPANGIITGMSDIQSLYFRQHLVLRFSSGKILPVFPIGKEEKEIHPDCVEKPI